MILLLLSTLLLHAHTFICNVNSNTNQETASIWKLKYSDVLCCLHVFTDTNKTCMNVLLVRRFCFCVLMNDYKYRKLYKTCVSILLSYEILCFSERLKFLVNTYYCGDVLGQLIVLAARTC